MYQFKGFVLGLSVEFPCSADVFNENKPPKLSKKKGRGVKKRGGGG